MRVSPERIARALLWFYPPAFRRSYGREMLQVVRAASAGAPRCTVCWMLARDAARSVAREWRATLHGSNTPSLNDPRPGEPMRNLLNDFRLAARTLAKSPGFSTAAIVTLALGIGANTAIFTLADATLLRPVAVKAPHELVAWSWTSSYPHYLEYAKRTDVFQGVLAIGGGSRVNLVIDRSAELTPAIHLSGNAFDVLGVGAALGRTLLPSDDTPGAPLVAVLGHDYWRSRFAEDPAVIGRAVKANGRPVTIVGVAQKAFRGTAVGSNPALYLSTAGWAQLRTGFGFMSKVDPLTTPGFVWLTVVGRLRPDVSVAQASAAMDALYSRIQPPRPGGRRESLQLVPMETRALGGSADDISRFVLVLLGVVAVTLLIGCANLANLLLARSASRRKEVGVRLALGASRMRVVQQMLAESLLLALAGAAAGLGVAAATIRALSRFQLPGGLPIAGVGLEIDSVALGVASALALVTGLIFGAAPAWRASRTDVLVSVRDQSRASTPRSGLRSTLLAAQVALSLVLLAGTGLFTRSLVSALELHPGFDPRDVTTASVNLGLARYDPGRAKGFYSEALAQVRSLPQVTAASWGSLMPTRGLFMGDTDVEGYTKGPDEHITVYGAHVGPEYFRAMDVPLRAGRVFVEGDRGGAPLVGIINDEMARKYWAGRDPIGGRFQMFENWITVVGVVEKTVVRQLREQPVPQIYLAFDQWLEGRAGIATDTAHLFVRGSVPPTTLGPLLRDRLRHIEPELPLYDIGSLEERVAALIMPQRMGATLFALFSGLALVLATVGVYGVAGYVAALRRREIGVRVALGATSSNVRRLMLRQNWKPIVSGIVGGLAMALYAGRLVQAFLVGVTPTDLPTFAAVTAGLAVTAFAASYVPAYRAAKTNPITALREE